MGEQSCQVQITSGLQSSADARTEVTDFNPQRFLEVHEPSFVTTSSVGLHEAAVFPKPCVCPREDAELLLLLYIPATCVLNVLSLHSLIKYFQVIRMNTDVTR